MKKTRLFLLFALTVLSILLCLSLSACDSKDAGITDDGLIWVKGEDGVHITGYSGIAEDLVIPASIQNTPVVAIDNSTFQNNGMLKTITIPDFVTTIGDLAFCGCDGLISVTIPNNVTTIGDSAFYGCDGLTSIVIPNSVTSISSSVFHNCKGLTSVTLGNSVTTIGNSAFDNCSNLTSIVIPDSVTSIGDWAFYSCPKLSAVYITDIGAWCSIHFANPSANPLTYAQNLYLNSELVSDVVIPDSVTTIGNYAFSGCSNLTSIVIPDSVTTIGDGAFSFCPKLKNVYYTGTVKQWAQISIGLYNSGLTRANIHYNYVPEA